MIYNLHLEILTLHFEPPLLTFSCMLQNVVKRVKLFLDLKTTNRRLNSSRKPIISDYLLSLYKDLTLYFLQRYQK